jgi:hypothetical protein
MPLEEYDRDITAFLKQLSERAQALAALAK